MNTETNSKSKPQMAVGLVISMAICFMAAGAGGYATTSSVSGWYVDINKPSWNPPNWIFGPVWTVLYFMMAISAWLVWVKSGLEKSKLALGWFLIQLVLNVFWSVLFFGLKQPGWACVEIAFLWMSILIVIVLFFRHSNWAAGLLVPYLLWVTFASFLNYTIWTLNQGA